MRYQKLTLVFLTVFLFLTLTSHAYATVTVPTNAYFGLPNYHTYINFDTSKTFNTIQRENNYWQFNNYKFEVQNGNLTITKFFTDNQLIFNVTAPSATTSTTRIYCGNQGKPATVTGATSWNYDSATKICTITVTHTSEEKIIVWWALSWAPSVRAIWNILPIIFLVAVSLRFISRKRKDEKITLSNIVMATVAFLILAILIPISLNLGWYG